MPRATPSLRLPRLSSQQAHQCALFQPFIKRAARGLARAAGPDFDELLSVGYEAVVCALLRFREGVGVLERFVNKTVVLEMVSAVRAYRRLRYREQLLGFASVYDEDTASGWDILKRLSPRWFVVRDAQGGGGAMLLQPRWAMSFMRGPMTRQEIKRARAL